MIIAARIRGRHGRAAALVAAGVALAPALAVAQDPPPPLAPAEPVAPPPPPPVPPAPDAPPRTDVAPPYTPPPYAPPVAPYAPPPYAPPSYTPPVPPASSSSTSPSPSSSPSGRLLGGLYLPSPVLLDSAFVQSHLGVGVEVGRRWDYGTLSTYTPPGAMPDAGYTLQFDQATNVSTQYGSFGIAVNDRVELGVSGSYQTALSTDTASVLLFGAKSAWTLRPVVRFQLMRSPVTALALVIYGDFGGDNQQNPQAALAEIANEIHTIAGSSGNGTNHTNCLGAGDLTCALTTGVYTATTRTLAGGGATVAVAHAFNSSVGLQSSFGLELGYRATDAGGTATASVPINFHVGIAPSVDFGPKVPLGLMLEDRFNVLGEPSVGDGDGNVVQVTNTLSFGVYYTGRHDLSLGAIFSSTFGYNTILFSDGSSQLYPPTATVTGQVAARYFF